VPEANIAPAHGFHKLSGGGYTPPLAFGMSTATEDTQRELLVIAQQYENVVEDPKRSGRGACFVVVRPPSRADFPHDPDDAHLGRKRLTRAVKSSGSTGLATASSAPRLRAILRKSVFPTRPPPDTAMILASGRSRRISVIV
jgi:hypothetical protein